MFFYIVSNLAVLWTRSRFQEHAEAVVRKGKNTGSYE